MPLEPSLLRNGAEIDARKGVVEITRADGGVAKFYDGIFKLSQSGGITTLTLSETLDCSRARRARRRRSPRRASCGATARASSAPRGATRRRRCAAPSGSSQDTCTSTTTRVTQGSVSVRDQVAKKTVVVRAGKRYVARAKRR